jgi:hypothetical protein
VDMPAMNGFGVLQALRRSANQLRTIPSFHHGLREPRQPS